MRLFRRKLAEVLAENFPLPVKVVPQKRVQQKITTLLYNFSVQATLCQIKNLFLTEFFAA
jgi:hypothetical protein